MDIRSRKVCVMQEAETVLDVLRERGRPNCHTHGINHWRAVMRGNPHVRFGPEAAGKGPAPCRHLAGVLPVPCVDEDFGPFFIKFGTYFPYTAKLCINGNEWAKRQAAKARAPALLTSTLVTC